MEQFERKLDMSEQREGGNPKEGSLESSDLSKALDMSSATTENFPWSLRAGDIISYLNDLSSSALKDHWKCSVVALDISKAFDRSLLSKLPSFGFPPSLCSLISSFLSNCSISAVVDGASSSSVSINCDVPQ